MNREKRRNGYMLLEVMAYSVILAVVLLIASRSFVDNLRLSAKGAQTLQRMEAWGNLREDLVRDVHASDAFASDAPGATAGARTLILRQGERLVVYDFFPGEQVAVRRIVYAPTESGEFELAALREYPAAFHEAAFEVNDRLVVFSARLSQRGQMRTAAAALQGWGAP